MPPMHAYTLHIKGPYIQTSSTNALMETGSAWVVIIHKSENAKFTINKLVWKIVLQSGLILFIHILKNDIVIQTYRGSQIFSNQEYDDDYSIAKERDTPKEEKQ